MDQGLPLDDDETEDFVKVEHYLLMSQHTQLKDRQNAHRLIGKKTKQTNKNKPIHVLTSLLGIPGLILHHCAFSQVQLP